MRVFTTPGTSAGLLLLLLCNSQGSILYCPGPVRLCGTCSNLISSWNWKRASGNLPPRWRLQNRELRGPQTGWEKGRGHWSCNLLLQAPTATLPLELPSGAVTSAGCCPEGTKSGGNGRHRGSYCASEELQTGNSKARPPASGLCNSPSTLAGILRIKLPQAVPQ